MLKMDHVRCFYWNCTKVLHHSQLTDVRYELCIKALMLSLEHPCRLHVTSLKILSCLFQIDKKESQSVEMELSSSHGF